MSLLKAEGGSFHTAQSAVQESVTRVQHNTAAAAEKGSNEAHVKYLASGKLSGLIYTLESSIVMSGYLHTVEESLRKGLITCPDNSYSHEKLLTKYNLCERMGVKILHCLVL